MTYSKEKNEVQKKKKKNVKKKRNIKTWKMGSSTKLLFIKKSETVELRWLRSMIGEEKVKTGNSQKQIEA